MDEDIEVLEGKLGHHFTNRGLLDRALTHKSRAFESGNALSSLNADNEQLEFLGDAILGFVISEQLFTRYPGYPEGKLSKLKAYLVSAAHLHEVARDLGLGEYLRLGRGEELSGGREKPALLANAVEALIAAIYLDGGLDAARAFILARVLGSFDAARSEDNSLTMDYKSALQEAAQNLGLPVPRYAIVKETGPEHRKTFTVEARIADRYAQRAEGSSKKTAGQRAAQLVLERLLEEQALVSKPAPPAVSRINACSPPAGGEAE